MDRETGVEASRRVLGRKWNKRRETAGGRGRGKKSRKKKGKKKRDLQHSIPTRVASPPEKLPSGRTLLETPRRRPQMPARQKSHESIIIVLPVPRDRVSRNRIKSPVALLQDGAKYIILYQHYTCIQGD